MIDLISIHIAKTGGRSFFVILKNEYGDSVDPRTRRVEFFPGKDYSTPLIDRIPEHVRILHGHLHYKHIREIHEKYNPRIIAWLREPVDRVISNYYYMISRVNELGEQHPQYRKRNHSLLEYARDSVPNKMSKCLQGIDLKDLFYFGFQESFDEDVHVLAGKLEWKKEIPKVEINTGASSNAWATAPTPKDSITEDMRREIAAINNKDIELYEYAKKLRTRV